MDAATVSIFCVYIFGLTDCNDQSNFNTAMNALCGTSTVPI